MGEQHPDYDLSYMAWHDWPAGSFLRYRQEDAAYFRGETQGIPMKELRVLEIGFGNGTFLGWARDNGADVFGSEVSQEAQNRARNAKVPLLDPDLRQACSKLSGSFDLVVAFDVLEHLTAHEIADLFAKLEALLRPGGHVIARFPNGQSPFGRHFQNADHTHRIALSEAIISQILQGRPWQRVSYGNAYRTKAGSLWRRTALSLRYATRDIVELAVRSIYALDAPLDTNVTIRLKRL